MTINSSSRSKMRATDNQHREKDMIYEVKLIVTYRNVNKIFLFIPTRLFAHECSPALSIVIACEEKSHNCQPVELTRKLFVHAEMLNSRNEHFLDSLPFHLLANHFAFRLQKKAKALERRIGKRKQTFFREITS